LSKRCPIQRERQERAADDQSDPVETNRHSDPRYAELILWIIAKKAALRYLHHD
jgi:hypothetical protein